MLHGTMLLFMYSELANVTEESQKNTYNDTTTQAF